MRRRGFWWSAGLAGVRRLGVALDHDDVERGVETNVDRRAVAARDLDLVGRSVLVVPLDGVDGSAVRCPERRRGGALRLRPSQLPALVVEGACRTGNRRATDCDR